MSVDLDSLINQSKQRLSKHKEYLEKTSQRTGYSSTNNNVAAIDASATTNNSSSARRGEEELSFSPLRPEERQQQQPQQQPLFPNSSNQQQQHTGFSPLTSNGQPQYNIQQQQTPQAQQPQFNPYSSNVARAGYTNYGEPEQQQHLSHNRHNTSSSSSRAGFYLSSRTPTKVYDRGQKFVESRESYLERQRQEAWEKEMKGCTFSPFISRKAATMKSSGGNGGKSPSPEKPSANKRGRSADESSHNDEPEMDHQEFLDWCVHSDKTNVGFHVDAPSVFLHIQRQQDARKQRADGQAKLTVDTAHWRPKVTVPQEFHFGRSDQPIRSLKKPIMNMVRLSSGDTIGSRSGSAAGGGRSSKSPASRRGTPRASKSPLRLTKKNVNASNNEDDDPEAEEAERQRIAKLKQMELNNRDQQKQLREQSEEIQKLSGMLSAMKMEAEAAKAKVREMTLSQTISGDK